MATSSKTMRCAGAMLLAATMAAVVCAQVDSAHNPVAEQASSSKNGIHIASDRVASFMWVLDDALGYRWDICSDGTIFDGTDDAYDSGMQLLVNGSSFPDSAGGTLSADSTEVEIGPWNHAGLKISRRVFINAKAGYCRWIDIFENEAAVEVNAKLQYCANMGADTHRTYTTSGGAQLTPKDWGAVTAGPSGNSSQIAVVHVFATPWARRKPVFRSSRGDDDVYYDANIRLPPGKAVGLCFFQAQRRPFESAVRFLKEFKPTRELALVPAPLRRVLLNMPDEYLRLAGVELKRSDECDLVVLRNGDEIHGEILAKAYSLRSGVGDLEVPAAQVIGLVSRSAEDDLVRLALTDGQIVAGVLTGGPLKINLPGRSVLSVPVRGMRQAAYRVCAEKPDEISVTTPLLELRHGDQLAFQDAKMRFGFQSSHGRLTLSAADLRSIEMDTPGGGLHRAVFRNGSCLAGLLADESLPVRLKLGPSMAIPRWQIRRIRLATDAPDGTCPTRLKLRNADVLFGRFTDDSWTLEGRFGKLKVIPAEVAEGECSRDSLGQVKLTLRNGTKIAGRIADDYLGFTLEPGPALKVFVGKIDSFASGRPPESPPTATAPQASQPADLGPARAAP